jgi:hypothetical protein
MKAMSKIQDNARAAMQVAATPPVEPNAIMATLSARMTQKAQVREQAKASLADAIALESDATAAIGAKEAAQGNAINVLAQGVIQELVSKDEVSAILGDAYGYKAKSDGTPGKTPDGSGSTLRKRVVLLSEAFGIVNGTIAEADKPKWAADKSIETLAPIVSQWLEGTLSPWQAYKDASEKEASATVELPYNEKQLLKIAKALGDDVSLARIRETPALMAVYTAMFEAFTRDIAEDIAFDDEPRQVAA